MGARDRIAKILAGKAGGPTPTGIHAYHSSPHDFDRFENKLLTGEGANVYGAGTYLAENPAVSGQGGQYWNQFLHRLPPEEQITAEMLSEAKFDRSAAAELARREIAGMQERIRRQPQLPGTDKSYRFGPADLQRAQERLALIEGGAPVGPRTYEVNFKAKPEELLDWDKPLPQQSPQVRGAMKNVESNLVRHWLADPDVYQSARGENIYEQLVGKHGKTEASAHLNDLGIPGIRYLDEGSRDIPHHRVSLENDIAKARAAGDQQLLNHYEGFLSRLPQPTHNYVAFDPSRLDIMAKYGVIGTAGALGGAKAMGGTFDPATYGERQ